MTQRARILIIDDDELSLEMLQFKLAQHYDVVATQNPANAVQLAHETRPDLILCDFDMPDMDGADVSAALREEAELRYIPLVFLTALATSSDMNRMRKQIAGRPAISKDVPLERLLARIEEMLKRE